MSEVRHTQQRCINSFIERVKTELTPEAFCRMQVGYDPDRDEWFAEVDGVRQVSVDAKLQKVA